jgi:nucleotide-binding universal stress UspA family protein
VAVQDYPVETLLDVVRRESADLLLVGSRGPADATRRSECDVLVVLPTG